MAMLRRNGGLGRGEGDLRRARGATGRTTADDRVSRGHTRWMRSHVMPLIVLVFITSPAVLLAQGSALDTPSREHVVTAMNEVSAAVAACGRGERGIAQVRLEFEGRTGLLKNARIVSGDPFSAPVQSCILDAVRPAHVPPFRHETFSVSYPFRL